MLSGLTEYLGTLESPIALIVGTIAATLAVQKAYQVYNDWDSKQIKKNITDTTVKILQKLPIIGPKVKAEVDKEVNGLLNGIQKETDDARKEWKTIANMPLVGLTDEQILNRFNTLQSHYKPGKLSGGVYSEYDQQLAQLLEKVWGKTALTNPMHSEWPLINLMEAEVISMCQNLLHGEPGAPGMMTHGGSTSILEACKAYVLEARRNGNSAPEIIVPDTAHVSFDKAAQTLNVKLVKIPVDPKTGKADLKAFEKAINKRTCLLVGSAPSFPFGVIDPIEALGGLAKKHNLPLHVDSCLGGFLTAFADSKYNIPKCDFSVPGVTSISIDTHKYGQAPKGTSVLLFSPDCKATPTQVNLEWVGGMYVTPGIDGSRSGADIATAWTVLCHKGQKEYIQETSAILDLQHELVNEIKKIDGIIIPYEPQLSVIAIQTRKEINSLLVADKMKDAGWSVNILQTSDQKAAGFHFCLTSVHTHQANFTQEFIKDLKTAVEYAKNNPNEKPKGTAKAYGKLEKGVPSFVQKQIGDGYVKILNTLPRPR